jgi:pyruvate dehydrogenase E2 component (dihydrolipoamide acetyltransferase)
MPSVAADATEAVLSSWTVAQNVLFKAGEVIAVIETAKAAVDLEAERNGVLLAMLVTEGTTVEVGAAIAVLGDPGERVDDLGALLAELFPEGSAAAPPQEPAAEFPSEVSQEPAAGLPPRAPSAGLPPRAPSAGLSPRAPSAGRVFASPLARRLAREAGLAIEQVPGSGPNGRVTGRDVRGAVAARQPEPPASAQQPEPLTRMRQAIASRMTQSKQTVPHFYVRGSVRAGALLKLRAEINANARVRVSLNDLIIKAVAQAHTRVPEMNVIWTPEAIRSFENVDVAVAIATDGGLVTPVVRNADTAAVTMIAGLSADLAARARDGKLKQHELEGGTITVSNLGMYGTEEFTAIINPPQAAILAVGAVRQEPVVNDDGAVVAAPLMRLTLSVDHRPVDGVTAAQWMRVLIEVLEQPIQILL